jgi:hypothetical protein
MTKMRAPARDRLAFIFNRARSFALHPSFLKLRIAVVTKNWFTTDEWQHDFAALMSFYFQRFLSLLQSARGQIVRSEERKTPRRFFAVTAINPKLRVITAVTLIEAADPTIARIADWDKLREMIFGNRLRFLCLRCGGRKPSLVGFGCSFYCFTLHAVNLAEAIFTYACLGISPSESTMPGWRNWQTRQT